MKISSYIVRYYDYKSYYNSHFAYDFLVTDYNVPLLKKITILKKKRKKGNKTDGG